MRAMSHRVRRSSNRCPAFEIRKACLSLKSLDERLGPALLTPSLGTDTTPAQSRSIVIAGGLTGAGATRGIIMAGG